MPKCNAHNRQGNLCGRTASPGHDKCKLHMGVKKADLGITTNGMSPVPFIKNKYYQSICDANIKEKMAALNDLPDLTDLRDELVLAKTLLQRALEDATYSTESISGMFTLIGKLSGLVSSYIETRNSTALTSAELMVVYAGLAQLKDFVPVDKQGAYIAKLRELIHKDEVVAHATTNQTPEAPIEP